MLFGDVQVTKLSQYLIQVKLQKPNKAGLLAKPFESATVTEAHLTEQRFALLRAGT